MVADMHLRLLIDGIVRQTTVLLAQISTSAGVRSPLSHIADQVFFELAKEIEAQGIKRRVAADMFGMALRAYQKKTQRLVESASTPNRTLWQAVLELIEEGETTRSRIEARFKKDGQPEVAAVLMDLVRSGLVYCTGSGEHAVYGVTRQDVRDRVQERAGLDSLAPRAAQPGAGKAANAAPWISRVSRARRRKAASFAWRAVASVERTRASRSCSRCRLVKAPTRCFCDTGQGCCEAEPNLPDDVTPRCGSTGFCELLLLGRVILPGNP